MEFEKLFDSAKELRNLGGTLVEFNKPEDNSIFLIIFNRLFSTL